jgi:hypothetical protein
MDNTLYDNPSILPIWLKGGSPIAPRRGVLSEEKQDERLTAANGHRAGRRRKTGG